MNQITNFKEISIGVLIHQRVKEAKMDMSCICSFLNCTKTEVQNTYSCKSLSSEMLLQWSKLLEYDFFRIYSQHLILYSPPSSRDSNKVIKNRKKVRPQNSKNIYTIEIIHFILELIEKGKKTKIQINYEYGIPKTTLYKWINKYRK